MSDPQIIFDSCQTLALDLQKVPEDSKAAQTLLAQYAVVYACASQKLPTPAQFTAALSAIQTPDAALVNTYQATYEIANAEGLPTPEAFAASLHVIQNISEVISICDPHKLYEASADMLAAIGPFDGFKLPPKEEDPREITSSLARKCAQATAALRAETFDKPTEAVGRNAVEATEAACWLLGKLVCLHQILSDYREKIGNDPEALNHITHQEAHILPLIHAPNSDVRVEHIMEPEELRQLRVNDVLPPENVPPPAPPCIPSPRR